MQGHDGIIGWDDIKRYKIMCRDNFIIALNSLTDIDFCKKENIKFYWNYPVNNFYDLKALKALGAEYALIDSPIFHNIVKVNEVGIKIRVVPNIAFYAYIPREDGVCGSWIRPEDLHLYENYIETIEFEDCDLKKEQALYRIYFEQKSWPGDLGMIITNFNHTGVNRMIPEDLTKARMTCGQRCQEGKHCRLCYTYLKLANPELLSSYKPNN